MHPRAPRHWFYTAGALPKPWLTTVSVERIPQCAWLFAHCQKAVPLKPVSSPESRWPQGSEVNVRHLVVTVVRWTDFTSGLTSGEIVVNEQFSKSFNPRGMSLPQGRGVPLSYVKENTVSQIIEAMSDVDLLSMIVGSKTAAQLLKDAGGSLTKVLYESMPSCNVRPRVRTKLRIATELVRRSLIEPMR